MEEFEKEKIQEDVVEKRKKKIVESVKKWLEDPSNAIFIAILIFSFAVRLYYFYITKSQAVWWDEGEYLLKANNVAFGTPDTGWWVGRPVLFPLIAALFFKLGLGEISVRFFWVLLSTANIVLVFLVAKRLFNKRVALISSFLFSVFYLDLFYTVRFLVDMPQIFFISLAAYLFVEGYFIGNNKKVAWFILPVLVVGILLRFTVGIFLISMFLFLLITERLRFLKDKRVLVSILLGILFYLPYAVYSFIKFKNPIYVIMYVLGTSDVGRPEGVSRFSIFVDYISYFPSYMHLLLTLAFLFGLGILLFNLFIGFDTVLKGSKKNQTYLLLFLWILFPLIYFGFFVNHFEDRYIFMIFPAVFMITGLGLDHVYNYIKKYNKMVAAIIVIIVLAYGGYLMLVGADAIIKDKVPTYRDLKEAGLWLEQNSDKNDVIIAGNVNLAGDPLLTGGYPQLVYYSKRAIYRNVADLDKEIALIKEKNAKYLVVTSWERSPQWLIDYLSEEQPYFIPVYQSTTPYHGTQNFAVVYSINHTAIEESA